MKVDSHKKSLSEAFVNSFGGFPIGYAVGIGILPLCVGWIQSDPLSANIAITGVFATVSFVRTYFLRRVFERCGFDDNLFHLCSKGITKLRKKYARYRLDDIKTAKEIWEDKRISRELLLGNLPHFANVPLSFKNNIICSVSCLDWNELDPEIRKDIAKFIKSTSFDLATNAINKMQKRWRESNR